MTASGVAWPESGTIPALAPTDSSAGPCATLICSMTPLQIARLDRRLCLVDVPQQHGEFVAAEPRHHVGGAHTAGEPGRHRLEQRVAGGVAVAVVDRLEAVEIDEHQYRRGGVALHIGERARQFALKTAPVENFEQRIDIGARLQFGNLPFRLDQFQFEPLDLRPQLRCGTERPVGFRLFGISTATSGPLRLLAL